MENKKMSPFAIISLISFVLCFCISFVINDLKTILLLAILTSLVAVISAIIALITMKRKNQKGKIISILAIIVGLMILMISSFLTFGIKLLMDPSVTAEGEICTNAVKCVDKKGVSTCKFKDVEQIEMRCNTSLLKEDQMK